jgi:hypothetical protein
LTRNVQFIENRAKPDEELVFRKWRCKTFEVFESRLFDSDVKCGMYPVEELNLTAGGTDQLLHDKEKMR